MVSFKIAHNGLQIGDGRAFQHPPAGGFVRSTELSATTKLSNGDETPPIANVLLWAGFINNRTSFFSFLFFNKFISYYSS
jgi:hypothetical protein